MSEIKYLPHQKDFYHTLNSLFKLDVYGPELLSEPAVGAEPAFGAGCTELTFLRQHTSPAFGQDRVEGSD